MTSVLLTRVKPDWATSSHPGVDAVLECFDLATSQNLNLLAGIFRHRQTADSRPDFSGSRLTGGGFPVEFAVAHNESGLRVTVEPGARGLDSQARRALALQLVQQIDAEALAHLSDDRLSILTKANNADYGAWIGLRLEQNKPSAKLYLEVPAGLSTEAIGLRLPMLARQNLALRMLGYSSAGEEYYLRIPALQPQELAGVLRPAGLSDQARPTLEMLEALYGHRLEGRLPGSSVGVSYTLGQSLPKATLYFFARSIWGSDRRIRENFLALGGDLWKARAAYSRATLPFIVREEWRTFHGLFGIVLQADATPRFVIGFRPPMS